MPDFDLLIRGGTVATAVDTFDADIAISGGRVAALGTNLGTADRTIDAGGMLVLPGGIDAHCHIEQESSTNIMTADDFYSGSVSAAFGGNTTFLPFAAQHRGQSLREVVKTAHERAGPKSVIDYAFHLIVSDPTESVLGQELPSLIHEGYTSFKVYLTYEMLKISDRQMLDVLSLARTHGAMTMVHAENDDVISWLSERLLTRGHVEPKFHAVAHAQIAESEASRRAIDLARLVDARLLIVHVSAPEAAQAILNARNKGLPIYGETCPQYLFLTMDDLDRDGMEGAKFCCSPPPRDKAGQDAIWLGLTNGTFQVFSSDHAPYRYDESGKFNAGPNPTFKKIANGVPGLETRMPLLFSEGVGKGRLSLNEFVALTSTNAAKIYGLHPRKGTIAIGADADIAIWDPEWQRTISQTMLHDAMDYTPYEGREVTGWPRMVISRGRVIVEDEKLNAERGSGTFLERQPDTENGTGLSTASPIAPDRIFGAELS
ncbi:MAG: dihydropyrimidinase [Hyphomicrobiales bacterium]|nr:dihydropyrimidinase [Hyphomicrobiales bacterium]MCP4997252.1 dihydropyrimidinase [Hyphomicrobiales bacterium]